ncbi:MAG TPA: hypothetical protein VMM82_12055 [Spirochaetia bacterium]|nr:hypothetical protein [Spirochaetia bacterium]
MPQAISALSVSLFLVLALAPRVAADAQFLGIAVAQSAGHDADGYVVLTGIHHSAEVSTFPHQESISVYTRWSGSGTHQVGISIWNMDTEETVAEAEEDVDFSPTAVTSFIKVFPHATFPGVGTYAVEVTLDGDLAAEYSLYVNVNDSYPDTPELVLSVPARDGAVDGAGNVSVEGIPDIFSFPRFPARESFELVTLWFSGEGSHVQRMEILDPTGVPIARSSRQEIKADYGKLELLTDSFSNVQLNARGVYTVVVYLDGEDVFEYPLPVKVN